MWIQRTARTFLILHGYHLSNILSLILKVLKFQEQDNGGKPQDQIWFPAPIWVARPQPVRCNHNPDSSNLTGGSCGKDKKEEKMYSCVSTMKKRQEQLT